MTKKVTTIEELEAEFNKVYLLADPYIIRMTVATVIGNLLGISDKPIWLLIIGGSSSGKTVIINAMNDIKMPFTGKNAIYPVDTLTTNTFASGFAGGGGKEVSLLHKANGGIFCFKDFTTITTMNEEALREIMGQMRAIYDGEFKKETGNGIEVTWHGQVGALAAGTSATMRKMRQFSEQGERFINYHLIAPDSKEATYRAIENIKDIKEKEQHLKEVTAEFIEGILEKTQNVSDFSLSKEVLEDMVNVSDLFTLARSPINRNRKTGEVEFIGDREMPMRAVGMFTTLAYSLIAMQTKNHKTLDEENAKIIYKSAMDSIPPERRMVMKLLAKYSGGSTPQMAAMLGYPTDPILNITRELCALKLVTRHPKKGINKSDLFVMLPQFKDLVCKYENITPENCEAKATELELEQLEEKTSAVDEAYLEEIYKKETVDVQQLDWGGFA